MSHAERAAEGQTAAQRRAAKKNEVKPAVVETAKPAAKKSEKKVAPVVELTDAEKDEAAYQEELRQEQEEEKKNLTEKNKKAMNGVGNAIAEHGAKTIDPAVAVDVKVLADEVVHLAKSADDLANEAAQVSADAKVVIEEIKVELATSHADMCDPNIFGSFDPNSDYCKDCLVQFTECANACRALTDSKKVAGTTKKASSGAKKSGTRSGERVLIASATSGAGQIDLLLCRPEGCTMAEMQVHRGAVTSHLAALKAAGFNIIQEGNKYFYRKPTEAAPAA